MVQFIMVCKDNTDYYIQMNEITKHTIYIYIEPFVNYRSLEGLYK